MRNPEEIRDKFCPSCKSRKPGKRTDCQIYRAVFNDYGRTATTEENLGKFFDNFGCKYYKAR